MSSWPWYVTRASGFVAVLLLAATVLWGIGQITGLTYKVMEPVKAWLVHKALALALLAVIAVHIGTILIDKFIDFRVSEVFIPFVSDYSNGSTLLGFGLGAVAMAAGIISLYLLIVIVATSLGWIDSKPRLWQRLHFLSYLTVGLIFIHGLGTGTDLRTGIWRGLWFSLGTLLLIGIISRLLRAGTLKR